MDKSIDQLKASKEVIEMFLSILYKSFMLRCNK